MPTSKTDRVGRRATVSKTSDGGGVAWASKRECHPAVARVGRELWLPYSAVMVEFAVPIMPANDLAATLSFYERLGFENAGSAPSEWNYLIIRRGGVQLHFYGDPQVDPLTTLSSCYVFTEDADASMRRGTRSELLPIRRRVAGCRDRRLTLTMGCASSLWSTQAGT